MSLDGVSVEPASLGAELAVDPGKHVVQVTAGALPAKRYEVLAEDGKTVTVDVEFEPAPRVALYSSLPRSWQVCDQARRLPSFTSHAHLRRREAHRGHRGRRRGHRGARLGSVTGLMADVFTLSLEMLAPLPEISELLSTL